MAWAVELGRRLIFTRVRPLVYRAWPLLSRSVISGVLVDSASSSGSFTLQEEERPRPGGDAPSRPEICRRQRFHLI